MKRFFAALAAILFVGTNAAAQTDGVKFITTPEGIVIEHTVPVEDVSRERPRKMKPVEDDPEPVAEAPADDGKIDIVPKNEITIIETPAPEVPKDTAKKDGSEHENKLAFGGRLGFGNATGIGLHLKIPVAKTQRMDIGAGAGFGRARDGYGLHYYELTWAYEWRFDIDDGIIGWHIGPALAFGGYGTSGKMSVPDTTTSGEVRTIRKTDKNSDQCVGFGALFGIEVDLSFIDSDHSLHSLLKDVLVGIDLRPMFYVPAVKKYPKMILSVGLSMRYSL